MKFSKKAFSLMPLAVATIMATHSSAEILIDNPKPTTDFVSGGSVAGQSFTPADAVDSTTNTATTRETLTLSSITFLRGSGATGQFTDNDEASALYLNIYTDSDGQLGATAGDRSLVGSSSNTVNYTASAQGDSMTFTFTGLDLDADTKYYAAFSSTSTNGQIELISVFLGVGNEYTGGAFINAENGISEIPSGRDAVFTAVFVPEPGSMGLLSAGLCLVWRRRRQS